MTTTSRPSILHIRATDANGDTLPAGGITVAYHQIITPGPNSALTIVAGISICNDFDNFQKLIGRKIAEARLRQWLLEEDVRGPGFVHFVMAEHTLIESKAEVTELETLEGNIRVVSVKESDVAITDSLIQEAIEAARSHRFDTYAGDCPDVLEEIENLLIVEDGDGDDGDGEEDDEDEDDEEEEEDDDDKSDEDDTFGDVFNELEDEMFKASDAEDDEDNDIFSKL